MPTKPANEVRFSAEWPPVSLEETEEPRRHSAMVAVAFGAAALVGVLASGAPGTALAVGFFGFLSGYALQEWLLWERSYGGDE